MSSERLKEKTVFITGAASGIGRAAALGAAAEGGRVICADLDEVGLAETVALIKAEGGAAIGHACNVMDKASVEEALAVGVSTFGGLQVVFNVAGIGGFAHTQELDEAVWNRMLGVNLTGPFLVSQAALGHLLANQSSAIVNVASVAGINGQAYSAAYCASKFGVVGLTKAMAVEFVKRGLRVNCVCPAAVMTPLVSGIALPDEADLALLGKLALVEKMTQPEEVAEALIFLACDGARSINGAALPLDFGNSAT